MKTIIKKAIEGGYMSDEISRCTIWLINSLGGLNIDHTFTDPYEEERQGKINIYSKEKIVIDPSFWQALGKACEWQFETDECLNDEHTHKGVPEEPIFCPECPNDEWLQNALRFHEINLTEGFENAVSWLEDLTKQL